MKVAAVVPHWNRRELLVTLLANLQTQTRPFDQIVVIDNGSTDGSPELAERAGAKVLRLDRNVGFAAAVNRGIQAAQADWIAILNNDVTLEADWLASLLNAAEHHHAWFATGKILRAGDPSTLDGAFDEISRGACACRCGAGKADAPVWNQPRRIRFASMTAALFRSDLFEDLGLLDENFESYLEDVDFGIRCALRERGGIYVPAAVAHHLGSATLGQWNKDTVRLISRNQVLLAAKHFRGLPRWPIVAGQLLWGVLALRHGTGWSYLRGKILGWETSRAYHQNSDHQNSDHQDSINGLGAIVEASEQEILALERQTGFDSYWRAYFWLLPR